MADELLNRAAASSPRNNSTLRTQFDRLQSEIWNQQQSARFSLETADILEQQMKIRSELDELGQIENENLAKWQRICALREQSAKDQKIAEQRTHRSNILSSFIPQFTDSTMATRFPFDDVRYPDDENRRSRESCFSPQSEISSSPLFLPAAPESANFSERYSMTLRDVRADMNVLLRELAFVHQNLQDLNARFSQERVARVYHRDKLIDSLRELIRDLVKLKEKNATDPVRLAQIDDEMRQANARLNAVQDEQKADLQEYHPIVLKKKPLEERRDLILNRLTTLKQHQSDLMASFNDLTDSQSSVFSSSSTTSSSASLNDLALASANLHLSAVQQSNRHHISLDEDGLSPPSYAAFIEERQKDRSDSGIASTHASGTDIDIDGTLISPRSIRSSSEIVTRHLQRPQIILSINFTSSTNSGSNIAVFVSRLLNVVQDDELDDFCLLLSLKTKKEQLEVHQHPFKPGISSETLINKYFGWTIDQPSGIASLALQIDLIHPRTNTFFARQQIALSSVTSDDEILYNMGLDIARAGHTHRAGYGAANDSIRRVRTFQAASTSRVRATSNLNRSESDGIEHGHYRRFQQQPQLDEFNANINSMLSWQANPSQHSIASTSIQALIAKSEKYRFRQIDPYRLQMEKVRIAVDQPLTTQYDASSAEPIYSNLSERPKEQAE